MEKLNYPLTHYEEERVLLGGLIIKTKPKHWRWINRQSGLQPDSYDMDYSIDGRTHCFEDITDLGNQLLQRSWQSIKFDLGALEKIAKTIFGCRMPSLGSKRQNGESFDSKGGRVFTEPRDWLWNGKCAFPVSWSIGRISPSGYDGSLGAYYIRDFLPFLEEEKDALKNSLRGYYYPVGSTEASIFIIEIYLRDLI